MSGRAWISAWTASRTAAINLSVFCCTVPSDGESRVQKSFLDRWNKTIVSSSFDYTYMIDTSEWDAEAMLMSLQVRVACRANSRPV